MKNMPTEVQISANVSRETKELLEKRTRQTGVKKGYLVEQALRHHLLALDVLPDDVVIRPRVVVSRAAWAKLEAHASEEPSQALVDLMSRRGD